MFKQSGCFVAALSVLGAVASAQNQNEPTTRPASGATGTILNAGGGSEPEERLVYLSRNAQRTGSRRTAEVTAQPGKGFRVSLGDDFELNFKNRLQIQGSHLNLDNDQDINTFRIRRARTKLSGHIWEDTMTYAVQLDWTRGTSLLDGWFRYEFYRDGDDDIAIRFGQQKPHFGREFTGTSEKLEFIDRSLSSQVFSGNRVTGAWVQGDHMEDKLHWDVGVGNGDAAGASSAVEAGTGRNNADDGFTYFANVNFDTVGDFGDESYEQGDLEGTEELAGTVGGAIMFGNHRLTSAFDVETVAFDIYTAWKFNGFHALAEAFFRSDDPEAASGRAEADSTGLTVGGSYTLPPSDGGNSQWGFGLRYSHVDLDDPALLLTGTRLSTVGAPATGAGDIREISATISNYYRKHQLKSQVGVSHFNTDPTGAQDLDDYSIDILFSMAF